MSAGQQSINDSWSKAASSRPLFNDLPTAYSSILRQVKDMPSNFTDVSNATDVIKREKAIDKVDDEVGLSAKYTSGEDAEERFQDLRNRWSSLAHRTPSTVRIVPGTTCYTAETSPASVTRLITQQSLPCSQLSSHRVGKPRTAPLANRDNYNLAKKPETHGAQLRYATENGGERVVDMSGVNSCHGHDAAAETPLKNDAPPSLYHKENATSTTAANGCTSLQNIVAGQDGANLATNLLDETSDLKDQASSARVVGPTARVAKHLRLAERENYDTGVPNYSRRVGDKVKRSSLKSGCVRQLTTLPEGGDYVSTEAYPDVDKDDDWETVNGSQFLRDEHRSFRLARSTAGSSVADYTSFASSGAPEALSNLSPGGLNRRRLNDISKEREPVLEQVRKHRNRLKPDFIISSGYLTPVSPVSEAAPTLLPPTKRRVVSVLPSTFTYRHPVPLDRSHSNPFKVTPPPLPGNDPGFCFQNGATRSNVPTACPEVKPRPHGHHSFSGNGSLADLSTGLASNGWTDIELKELDSTSASSWSIRCPGSTPCPPRRTHIRRHSMQESPYYSSTQWPRIADVSTGLKSQRLDRPLERQGSSVSSEDSASRVSDGESGFSWEKLYSDSTQLLHEDCNIKRRRYHSGSFKHAASESLARLSDGVSRRFSQPTLRSFIPLSDTPNVVRPEPCLLQETRRSRPFSALPLGDPPALFENAMRHQDNNTQTKRHSMLGFRRQKREDELLRRRLTQIELGSFHEFRGPIVAAFSRNRSPPPYATEARRHDSAYQRVQDWLSTDMETAHGNNDGNIEASNGRLEAGEEGYRTQHGRYIFPEPPQLISNAKAREVRRKSLRHPLPPSFPGSPFEYILRQRQLGREMLLLFSLAVPLGWLVVAYIAVGGSGADSIMKWRSGNMVREWNYKERKLARWLSMGQTALVLFLVVVIPPVLLA